MHTFFSAADHVCLKIKVQINFISHNIHECVLVTTLSCAFDWFQLSLMQENITQAVDDYQCKFPDRQECFHSDVNQQLLVVPRLMQCLGTIWSVYTLKKFEKEWTANPLPPYPPPPTIFFNKIETHKRLQGMFLSETVHNSEWCRTG